MLTALQVITTVMVALAMVPAVAHALELPGKMRLNREAYLTVQPIYYPGFTFIGGFAEAAGMLCALALLFLTPPDTAAFWLTLWASIALVVMHAVFWVFTQPVNRFWLREHQLGTAGAAFFRVERGDSSPQRDWRQARDRWEYSHVVRAVLVTIAVALLASAIAVS
jgi:hypothetical protein